MLFNIYAGLGGCFGGAQFICTEDFHDESAAEDYARQEAVSIYESYAGTQGIRDIPDIMEEDEVDEEDAQAIMLEEIDSWIDYYALLVDEDDQN